MSINACVLSLVLALSLTATVVAQPPVKVNKDAATLTEFTARVKEYMTLHQKLANETGPIDETRDPKKITDREIALGQRLRAARAQAGRGEIFTPPVEALFKRLIRAEFARRTKTERANRREDQDELADFTPTVNQVYPSTQPLVTFPPGLLRVLPKLPRELEYRLVQRHLILRDVEANLIVDVIPGVTP